MREDLLNRTVSEKLRAGRPVCAAWAQLAAM